MPAPRFRIEIDAASYARHLDTIVDHMTDVRPAFMSIHRSFLGIETAQFASQGGLSGGWAPLSPGRIEAKAQAGLDPRIMHATLRLRGSLTKSSHPDHVFRTSRDEVTMGTRVPHARFNRDRPVVVITREHRRRWAHVLQRWIFRGQVMDA